MKNKLKKNKYLTQSRLTELLHYDPTTGIFTWIKQVCNSVNVGDIAGSEHKVDGYIQIGVDGVLYRAHRLAFLYMTGAFPDVHVDHISGLRADNRWTNLRNADALINLKNAKLSRNNKTGIIGVSITQAKNTRGKTYFYASITVNYKSIPLYHGKDLFEACCRRKSAEIKHGFHVNHGRIS